MISSGIQPEGYLQRNYIGDDAQRNFMVGRGLWRVGVYERIVLALSKPSMVPARISIRISTTRSILQAEQLAHSPGIGISLLEDYLFVCTYTYRHTHKPGTYMHINIGICMYIYIHTFVCIFAYSDASRASILHLLQGESFAGPWPCVSPSTRSQSSESGSPLRLTARRKSGVYRPRCVSGVVSVSPSLVYGTRLGY